MIKKIIVFLCCQFLLGQVTYAGGLVDVAAVVKVNADAVVAVIAPKKNRMEAELSANTSASVSKYVLGTGFIISEDGYVLTNSHVVEKESQIRIKFKNEQELPATLVGIDIPTDIALLKINSAGLPKVKIGSSVALEIGQPVIAIGWPFGLGQAVTTGIVSAKDLLVPMKGNIPFIQTDTVLNEGNSGGPLLDAQGGVVGVNSWIYTNTGRYQGMSFAIPIELAMNVAERLKKSPKVLRGWLGIKTEDASFSSPGLYGALILSFAPNSPAQDAGLREGDIVVVFNQKTVESSADLTAKVKATPADTVIVVEIIRQGERRLIKVKTGRDSKSYL